MDITQNALFILADDNQDHPPGHGVALRIWRTLKKQGLHCKRPDNWRDSGWYVDCAFNGSSLEIVVAPGIVEGGWILRVAPDPMPHFWTRWFARKAPLAVLACSELAQVVDRILHDLGASDVHWRWDGLPEPTDPEHPQPL